MENAAERLLGLNIQDQGTGQASQPDRRHRDHGHRGGQRQPRPPDREDYKRGRGRTQEDRAQVDQHQRKDITDESGYIDALGKEASARAINEAKSLAGEEMVKSAPPAERRRRPGCQAPKPPPRRTWQDHRCRVGCPSTGEGSGSRETAVAAEKVKSAQPSKPMPRLGEKAGPTANRLANANIVVPAEIEKIRLKPCGS